MCAGLNSLNNIFDWIRNVKMNGKVEEEFSIDYDNNPYGIANFGWNDSEYLDRNGYWQLLDDVGSDFDDFISNEKDITHRNVIRDTVHTIYGIPGSGKSRFLMERAKRIKRSNATILPIIITFNDKCGYPIPKDNVRRNDVWKEIIARIGFSLFGDNNINTFGSISNDLDDARDNLFFKQLNWPTLVYGIINYVNKVKGTKYEGITLLIDEILRTSENGVEMDSTFLQMFRDGRDNGELTRKQLSFLFTTLNSYSWIVKETDELGRGVITYYLPHFSDTTVASQLAYIPQNRLNQALYSSVLVNFRPRYMREILHNYKNEKILKTFDNSKDSEIHKKALKMNDKFWDTISNKIFEINDKAFDFTFSNKICRFDDVLISDKRVCDLVAKGTIIPYKSDKNRYETSFIPQVSMLAILDYLEKKHKENNMIGIEKELFKLIANYVEVGDSFEKFHLLFEAFRFNAFVKDKCDIMTVDEYFGHKLHFCNYNVKLTQLLFKDMIKKNDFEEINDSFDKFLDNLNDWPQSERDGYLLSNVFWFCGSKQCQPGFDSLIIYKTIGNELFWLFIESKYMHPRNPRNTSNLGNLEIKNIETKAINFCDIISNNKYKHNNYDWFKNVRKLLIYCDYKDFDIDYHLPTLNDKIYENVAIFAQDINDNKSQLTRHFGPTWQPILSHYIGQQYPESAKQSKLY